MANSKNTDRRQGKALSQNEDLDVAITELHQTIVRLNKAIEKVNSPSEPLRKASKPGTTQGNESLDLATIDIPKIYH